MSWSRPGSMLALSCWFWCSGGVDIMLLACTCLSWWLVCVLCGRCFLFPFPDAEPSAIGKKVAVQE